MAFLVNTRAFANLATVHDVSCPQTKKANRTPGNWLGPFDTLEEAEAASREQLLHPSFCRVCGRSRRSETFGEPALTVGARATRTATHLRETAANARPSTLSLAEALEDLAAARE